MLVWELHCFVLLALFPNTEIRHLGFGIVPLIKDQSDSRSIFVLAERLHQFKYYKDRLDVPVGLKQGLWAKWDRVTSMSIIIFLSQSDPLKINVISNGIERKIVRFSNRPRSRKLCYVAHLGEGSFIRLGQDNRILFCFGWGAKYLAPHRSLYWYFGKSINYYIYRVTPLQKLLANWSYCKSCRIGIEIELFYWNRSQRRKKNS